MGWYRKMGNKCWNKVISTMTKYRVNLLSLAKHGVTFFVYTRHGYVMQRIYPNEKYWTSLASNPEFFYLNYVAPELVTRELKEKYEVYFAVNEIMEEMLSSISFIDESPLRMIVSPHPVWITPKTCLIAGGKGRGRDQFLATPQKGNPNPHIYLWKMLLYLQTSGYWNARE